MKGRMTKIVLAVCLVLIMAGGVFAMSGQPKADYVTNSKEIVKAADWKQMKTVTVKIAEHSYTPEDLEFEAGQPYKLELVNVGKKKHYWTAPDFFKAIATRKAQSNKDGEIKAPYFLALEMMAEGGQLDLYFVPVNKGTYEIICTIDDHREQGMEGTVTIK